MRKDFGPNGREVEELIARLEGVNQLQALFLASLADDDPARRDARRAVVQAAERLGRRDQLRAAQDEVRRWVNHWFSGGPELSGYTRDITPAQAALDASPVVLDAIGAAVVRDQLSTAEYETLTDPWRQLWEPPGGPETTTGA